MRKQTLLDPIAFTIEILSPVHIGTGEKLGWMSMVTKGKDLHIVDEACLLRSVGQTSRRQEEFLRYAERGRDLEEYLRRSGISTTEVSAYSVPLVGERPSREILPFIKSPGSPSHPYIPGSSLKGAMRMAFLRAALQSDPSLLAEAQANVQKHINSGRDARNAGDTIEMLFFGKDQHHDWMRAFHFRDTRTLGTDALAVVQVQTLSTTQSKTLNPKRWSVHPEVIMPSECIKAEAVIQTYLLRTPLQCGLDERKAKQWIPQFIRKCNEAAQAWIDHEITFYQQYQNSDLLQWYKQQKLKVAAWLKNPAATMCLLWLGWGSGYENQSVGDLFEKSLLSDLRTEYAMGKIIHRKCGYDVRRDRKPRGQNRWSCRRCKCNGIHDDNVILIWPFAKSRKVALMPEGHRPLGWIKLSL